MINKKTGQELQSSALSEFWQETVDAKHKDIKLTDLDNSKYAKLFSSPLAKLIPWLINQYGWNITKQELLASLPVNTDNFTIIDFRNALDSLGYESVMVSTELDKIDLTMLPAMITTEDDKAYLLLNKRGRLVFLDVATEQVVHLRPQLVNLVTLNASEEVTAKQDNIELESKQITSYLSEWWRLIRGAWSVSMLNATISLIAPLFVMFTYDRVIGTASFGMVFGIFIGISFVLAVDLVLRRYRSSLLAYATTRFNYVISNTIFDKLIEYPSQSVKKATINSQLSRLRDIENIKQILQQPLGSMVMELPAVILFLLAIAWLGGVLVLIPVVAIAAYLLLGYIQIKVQNNQQNNLSAYDKKRQQYLLETIDKIDVLRANRGKQYWQDRYQRITKKTVQLHRQQAFMGNIISTMAQTISLLAGLVLLFWGSLLAMNGLITIGGLIATLIILWRVLTPIQAICLSYRSLQHYYNSLQFIQQLTPNNTVQHDKPLEEDKEHSILVQQLSFRYPNQGVVLNGINCSINSGDIVAVIGANSSGKTTLLELIAGIHQPQAGHIYINNHDIRQYDSQALSKRVTLISNTPQFFTLSIYDNLTMANTELLMEDIWHVLAKLSLLEEIKQLPNGIHTIIKQHNQLQLTDNFKLRLSLARALLSKVPILLIDEIVNIFDYEQEFQFAELIKEWRGKKTVLWITQRPSHLNLVDKVLMLNQGAISYYGEPDKLLGEKNIKDNMYEKS